LVAVATLGIAGAGLASAESVTLVVAPDCVAVEAVAAPELAPAAELAADLGQEVAWLAVQMPETGRFWYCQYCYDTYNACTAPPSYCQDFLEACLDRLGGDGQTRRHRLCEARWRAWLREAGGGGEPLPAFCALLAMGRDGRGPTR
jgi:hypothetical protein